MSDEQRSCLHDDLHRLRQEVRDLHVELIRAKCELAVKLNNIQNEIERIGKE
jgi:hypothetical protein